MRRSRSRTSRHSSSFVASLLEPHRHELQKAGEPHTAADVAEALSNIKWGRDRALNENTVAKPLGLYSRVQDSPGAIDWIMKAQALWGRGSPWEEWTKLAATHAPCKTSKELLWVLQSIFYEKLSNVRSDNYSKEELTRRANVLQVLLLRHRFVTGAVELHWKPAAEHFLEGARACGSGAARGSTAVPKGVPVCPHLPAGLPGWRRLGRAGSAPRRGRLAPEVDVVAPSEAPAQLPRGEV